MNLSPSDRPHPGRFRVELGHDRHYHLWQGLCCNCGHAAGWIGSEQEISPDGEYLVWLPRTAVDYLRALRAAGETFSDVILRLAARGSYSAIITIGAALTAECLMTRRAASHTTTPILFSKIETASGTPLRAFRRRQD